MVEGGSDGNRGDTRSGARVTTTAIKLLLLKMVTAVMAMVVMTIMVAALACVSACVFMRLCVCNFVCARRICVCVCVSLT